jgi:hypothetical protein
MFKTIAAATLLGGLSAVAAIPTPQTPSSLSTLATDQTPSGSRTRGYLLPEPLGDPVSFCLDAGRQCGKPAADAFCRGNGFGEALTFQRESLQPDLETQYFHQIKCWQPHSTAET